MSATFYLESLYFKWKLVNILSETFFILKVFLWILNFDNFFSGFFPCNYFIYSTKLQFCQALKFVKLEQFLKKNFKISRCFWTTNFFISIKFPSLPPLPQTPQYSTDSKNHRQQEKSISMCNCSCSCMFWRAAARKEDQIPWS